MVKSTDASFSQLFAIFFLFFFLPPIYNEKYGIKHHKVCGACICMFMYIHTRPVIYVNAYIKEHVPQHTSERFVETVRVRLYTYAYE